MIAIMNNPSFSLPSCKIRARKKAIERYCKNLIFSGNSTELFEDLVSNHQIVNYRIMPKAQKSSRPQVELGPIDSFV